MSAHRFFLTRPVVIDGSSVRFTLSAEQAHHAARVARVKPGETVEVVAPGSGHVLTVRIEAINGSEMRGLLLGRSDRIALPRVVLVQGVAKGEKMDTVIRQAVEVGVEEVIPVITERCIVRLDDRRSAEKGERWRRVGLAAAQQSHRDDLPAVRDPEPLSVFVEEVPQFDAVLVLWEECTGTGIAETLGRLDLGAGAARVALVVGPEGGLSSEEVDQLKARGAVVVSVGPTILRTETAAVVAVALASHTLGGMGSPGVS